MDAARRATGPMSGAPSNDISGSMADNKSGIMSDVRIRAAVAVDCAPLLALWRTVFPEYNDPQRPQRDPRASIERKLAFADGLFWVAQSDAQLVGSAMAGYDGHRGWLYSVGVLPRLRRSGLARALVTHAEAELARRGCPKINLQVLAG